MSSPALPAPTDRLRFRHYERSDFDDVVEMFSDDEAKRWYPTQAQPDDAARWIEWNLSNYDDIGFGLWVVETRDTGVFLGDCGLTYQTVENARVLELGYHLQLRHRGNGYALEGARGCLDHALGTLGASTLCSIVDPANRSSIRIAREIHQSRRTFRHAEGQEWDLFWTDRWRHQDSCPNEDRPKMPMPQR